MQLINFTVLFIIPLVYASIDTLKLVSVVFRHGDRTPFVIYPNDPYQDQEKFWPEGLGQLTTTGMEQLYGLGQYLRKRYDGFLNQTYLKDEIYVQSTDFGRTLNSAYSCLAGLYPPVGRQVWNPKIPWQPIPVHTRPIEQEYMLYASNCKRDYDIWDDFLNSTMMRYEDRRNRAFYEMIAQKTGYPTKNLNSIWAVCDPLFIEKIHGFILPSWATDDVLNKLWNLSNLPLTLPGLPRLREMIKLHAGEWIYKVTSDMHKMINGTMSPKQKMFMYSAHDNTVSGFFQAMHAYNNIQPPYAAALLLELHQKNGGQPYVQLFLRNDTSTDPYLLTMKGCAPECPLSKFVTLTEDVSIPDARPYCNQGSRK